MTARADTAERIRRQQRLIAQFMSALNMDPTNIGKLSGVGGSTISRALKPDTTNIWRNATLDRLREFARANNMDLDVATLMLRDADGNEVPVMTEPHGRPRRSAADIVSAIDGHDGGVDAVVAPVAATAANADRRLPVRGRIVDAFRLGGSAPSVMLQSPLSGDETASVGCPPWLLSDETAYALRVDGEGLAPVLLPGDYVYVTSIIQRLRVGDIVIVSETVGNSQFGGMNEPVCGLFVERSRAGDSVKLRLTQPPQDDNDGWWHCASLHRVAGIRRA